MNNIKLKHTAFVIRRNNEDSGITYLNFVEMAAFGQRITFTPRVKDAMEFLTFYEAAATMCYLIEQLDADLMEELDIVQI